MLTRHYCLCTNFTQVIDRKARRLVLSSLRARCCVSMRLLQAHRLLDLGTARFVNPTACSVYFVIQTASRRPCIRLYYFCVQCTVCILAGMSCGWAQARTVTLSNSVNAVIVYSCVAELKCVARDR